MPFNLFTIIASTMHQPSSNNNNYNNYNKKQVECARHCIYLTPTALTIPNSQCRKIFFFTLTQKGLSARCLFY